MDWGLRDGYAWAGEEEHCEEYCCVLSADPTQVSLKAKKRELPQLSALGAGNYLAKVKVIDGI